MEKTAYTEWLNNCAARQDPPYRQEIIAYLIYGDLQEQSPKAFDLITEAGHTLVTLETLMDTAKQVMELKNITQCQPN